MTNRIRKSNRTTNAAATSISKGGVSLEAGRGYRGSVSVNGRRYRTRRHETKTAALRALNQLRANLVSG